MYRAGPRASSLVTRLQKAALLSRFEESIRQSGANLLYITSGVAHPSRYVVQTSNQSTKVKVYIWNITPGGKSRPEKEWRIQLTGIAGFSQETGVKTLILGWQEDLGVFAGWDIRKHGGTLGASPSFQIHEDTLQQAERSGFASYLKANKETAISFRPEFAATYVDLLEALHDSGAIDHEAEILGQLSKNPAQVSDAIIEDGVAKPRRYAIFLAKRELRENDFNRRVLSAYDHRCAMCGLQLRLVDAAHILPVSESASTDQTRNGVALCALHHRAYDSSLVTFDVSLKVHLNERRMAELRKEDRIDRLKEFRAWLLPFVHSPADKRDRPGSNFVTRANRLRGWRLVSF